MRIIFGLLCLAALFVIAVVAVCLEEQRIGEVRERTHQDTETLDRYSDARQRALQAANSHRVRKARLVR